MPQPKRSETFMGNTFLPNGALVIMRKEDTVLCSYGGEYVTWKVDRQNNAFWGHYFKSFNKAHESFQSRSAANSQGRG